MCMLRWRLEVGVVQDVESLFAASYINECVL